MRRLLAALLAPAAGAADALQCLPFPIVNNSAQQGTLCTNATDACFCEVRADAAPQCKACVALPCLNQTWRMADASGVKLSIDRLVSLSAIRPERIDLGDLVGCHYIPDTHWCLWLTDNALQPILGGVCVPSACSPQQQYQLRQILSMLYLQELATLPSNSSQRAEVMYAAQAIGSTPGRHLPGSIDPNETDAVGSHCTTAKDGNTFRRDVWRDGDAVAVAAFLCALPGVALLCTALLEAREAVARRSAAGRGDAAPLLGAGPCPASAEKAAPRPLGTTGATDGSVPAEPSGGARSSGCINPESDDSDGAEEEEPAPSVWRRRLGAAAGRACAAAACFDARAHFAALIRVGPRRPTSFLHGFRVYSIMWVVLGHVANFPDVPGVDNIPQVISDYTMKFRDVLMYGQPAVDSFFFMSGFLGCYLLIPRWRSARIRSVPKAVWTYLFIYIDRWVRLTPVYALCIWINLHLIQYMVTGPLNVLAKGGALCGDCSEDWWRNVLYINTIPKADGELSWCLSHTWYLGDDMFFVWMFTPITVLYVYRKREAVAITVAAMALALAYAAQHDDAPTGGTKNSEKGYYYPWGRAPPYLWGLLTAFALRHEPAAAAIRRCVAHPLRRLALYVVGGGVLGGIVVWQWWTERADPQFVMMEPWADVTYTNSLIARPLPKAAWRAKNFAYYFGWGLGLMILTFVWVNGHGGVVVDFLSHPVHEVLGRLTYCVYLVHPMLLTIMKLSHVTTALPHYTDYWLLEMWITAGVASFVTAALLNVFFERPVAALWDAATAKSKRNTAARGGGARAGGDDAQPTGKTTGGTGP